MIMNRASHPPPLAVAVLVAASAVLVAALAAPSMKAQSLRCSHTTSTRSIARSSNTCSSSFSPISTRRPSGMCVCVRLCAFGECHVFCVCLLHVECMLRGPLLVHRVASRVELSLNVCSLSLMRECDRVGHPLSTMTRMPFTTAVYIYHVDVCICACVHCACSESGLAAYQTLYTRYQEVLDRDQEEAEYALMNQVCVRDESDSERITTRNFLRLFFVS